MDNKNSHYSFDDIIRGFQHAVNCAQEMLTAQHLEMLGKFFTEDGAAITRTVVSRSGQKMEVPLLTLVPQNTLAIDEIDMSFVTKIKDVTRHTHNDALGNNVSRLGWEMGLESMSSKDNDLVRVNIKFKASQQPDGLLKLIEDQHGGSPTLPADGNGRQ